jgi:holo-[acyl-carrier protein] synthase
MDAMEIQRIADSIERHGDRFLRHVFTSGEIAYCRRKRDFASSFAARFAAKEAAMKALGTGFSRGVYWLGIEVVRGRYGPPQLQFHAGALERFTALGATKSLLTLTHSRDLSIAHVLLMRD